jgi:hypothetical protein
MVTVYTLFQATKHDDEEIQLRYVFLGSVFAAGTALTKQNGLLVFAAYPVLAYWMILKD